MAPYGASARALVMFFSLILLFQSAAAGECMKDGCEAEAPDEFSTLQATLRFAENFGQQAPTPPSAEELPESAPATHVQLWDAYVAATRRAARFGLQPDCEPVRVEAAAGTAYKGVAILFHGFTACPIQWSQYPRLLSERGYEVLVPLLPGHGHAIPPPWMPVRGTCLPSMTWCIYPLDDVSSMPTDVSAWRQFVRTMNDIVSRAPVGLHVVAGLSTGAAVAAHAGQATDSDGAALYQRQLILAPMLNITACQERAALAIFGQVYGALTRRDRNGEKQYMGWGSACGHARVEGRAGTCSFQFRHGIIASLFGALTLEEATLPKGADISVHYGLNDPNDMRGARQLVTRYGQVGPRVHTCVWNFSEHVMINMEDSLDVNKWYIRKVTCQIVNYLADGTPIPQLAEREPSEGNVNYCELGCDNTTCPEIRHLKKGDVPTFTCP